MNENDFRHFDNNTGLRVFILFIDCGRRRGQPVRIGQSVTSISSHCPTQPGKPLVTGYHQ